MPLKMVIVVRRDLSMTRGKECAQVAHAVLMSVLPRQSDGLIMEWLENSQAKVVLSAEDGVELVSIMDAADSAGLFIQPVIDAGRTMFSGMPTRTCVAIGPDEIEKIDSVTGALKLR